MTKRPTRAKRIAAWLQASGAESSVHELARGLAELIGSLAGSELELEDAIRGACRMRDLYRAERSRADEAERLLERVAGEVDDVLAGIPVYLADEIAALMRARQEQRGKGGAK
jgi:uncharacterized protein YbaR (Trm112 family)